MKTTKAELIINAHSRSGKAAIEPVLIACKKHGITLNHIHKLKRGDNLADVLAGVTNRNPNLVIVGGGDGTISDAVDHLAGTDIEVGLIPLGTTNNFARSLNIPLDIDSAIKTISKNGAHPVDLGNMNDDYFTNVAGIGISALVAKNVTNERKKRWGRMAYALTGALELIKHKPFSATIQDKDSELLVNIETHQIIVANGRYHAGKKIAEGAEVDNRELIIFAIGGRNKLSFIWHMIDFYIGKRKSIHHASYLIGKSIILKTSTNQQVELDGEVKFTTPATIQVTPDAIKVRYDKTHAK